MHMTASETGDSSCRNSVGKDLDGQVKMSEAITVMEAASSSSAELAFAEASALPSVETTDRHPSATITMKEEVHAVFELMLLEQWRIGMTPTPSLTVAAAAVGSEPPLPVAGQARGVPGALHWLRGAIEYLQASTTMPMRMEDVYTVDGKLTTVSRMVRPHRGSSSSCGFEGAADAHLIEEAIVVEARADVEQCPRKA